MDLGLSGLEKELHMLTLHPSFSTNAMCLFVFKALASFLITAVFLNNDFLSTSSYDNKENPNLFIYFMEGSQDSIRTSIHWVFRTMPSFSRAASHKGSSQRTRIAGNDGDIMSTLDHTLL